jgi:hypothetical protein
LHISLDLYKFPIVILFILYILVKSKDLVHNNFLSLYFRYYYFGFMSSSILSILLKNYNILTAASDKKSIKSILITFILIMLLMSLLNIVFSYVLSIFFSISNTLFKSDSYYSSWHQNKKKVFSRRYMMNITCFFDFIIYLEYFVS